MFVLAKTDKMAVYSCKCSDSISARKAKISEDIQTTPRFYPKFAQV